MILEVENLSFGYAKNKPVFQDIAFQMGLGEAFCVIGPNGCGKSTLIDALLGANAPFTGSIKIDGRNRLRMKPNEIARKVAYIPQNHVKTFPYTTLDVVVMGRAYDTGLFSAPDEDAEEMALRALDEVGLRGFENRLYTELSGGETQLALIARALAQSADLILMDEPTAHLDFRHELQVLELISRIVKSGTHSVIMATHFLNQPFFLKSLGVPVRVALMNEGRFQKIGDPDDVMTGERLFAVYNTEVSIAEADFNGIRKKYIIPLHYGSARQQNDI